MTTARCCASRCSSTRRSGVVAMGLGRERPRQQRRGSGRRILRRSHQADDRRFG
ncbi:Protein of unknown function [Gryllus bimaculatus]|nr:Protein of unknown function [Gryllus bimaculatus]